MLKTHDEIIAEFLKRREELKNWQYGTVYKGYDQEEEAQVLADDVDRYFSEDWLKTTLETRDDEVRELVEGKVEYLTDVYDTDEWSQAYVRGVKALEEHILTQLNNNK